MPQGNEPVATLAFQYWLTVTAPEKHPGLRTARILLADYDGDSERAEWMRISLRDRGLLGEFHLATLQAAMNEASD